MAFINIFVESQSSIYVKNNQLTLINSLNMTEDFPLTDINSILIDNQKTNISVYTLSKLIENNIALYICNEKHLPVGSFFSNSFFSNLKIFEIQLKTKKTLLKQIWKKIIETKIDNQSTVLKLCGKDFEYLKNIKMKVLAGDKGNAEASGANYYFKTLFGKDFKRRDENLVVNSCLNYGYAIVRGIIARTITAYGLIPFLGVFHRNYLNNFNLVDDLIEVFRPIVDLFVYENIDFTQNDLTPQIKHEIFNIQNCDLKIQGKMLPLFQAIEIYVVSYINMLEKSDVTKLKLPQIVALKVHRYE